jgi:hypothetical protein
MELPNDIVADAAGDADAQALFMIIPGHIWTIV